jgi:hypothetical protein
LPMNPPIFPINGFVAVFARSSIKAVRWSKTF